MRVWVAFVLALATGCDREPIQVTEAPQKTPQAPTREPVAEPFEASRVEHKSGLVVETLSAGRGPAASTGSRVSIQYTGRVVETGEEFSTTRKNGIPFRFVLGEGQVIRGFERGLLGARAGSEIRLGVPAALAYGDDGWGDVPGGADLEFDIKVVHVE